MNPGITRMKSLARSYFRWLNMDKFMGDFVNSCEQCQVNHNMPPCAPVHRWENTKTPWVYVDYVCPFFGKILITIPFQSALKFFLLKHHLQKWLKKVFCDSWTSLNLSWTSSERLMYIQFTFCVYGVVLIIALTHCAMGFCERLIKKDKRLISF